MSWGYINYTVRLWCRIALMVFPDLYWAQRSSATEESKNVIYLTIGVANLVEEAIELTTTGFKFSGKDSKTTYNCEFEWFDEIDVEKSKTTKTGRGLFYVLQKKKLQEEYWPRLTKDKVRRPYIHTDFDKWVDEDEQDEQPELDMPDMGGMAGMGGAGGAGGAGGFDMAALQQMMAAQGGAGGAGGFDLSALGGDPSGNDEISSTLAEADEREPEEANDDDAKVKEL